MKTLISPSFVTILLLIGLIGSCKQSVSPEEALRKNLESMQNDTLRMEVSGINYWITRSYRDTSTEINHTTVATFDTIKATLNHIFSFYSGSNIRFMPYFQIKNGVFGDSLYIQYQTVTGTEYGSTKLHNFTLDEALLVFSKDKRIIKYLKLKNVKGTDWRILNGYEQGSTQSHDELSFEFIDIPYSIVNGVYQFTLSSEDIRNYLTIFNNFKNYSSYRRGIDGSYKSTDEHIRFISDIPLEINDNAYIKFSLTP